MAETLQTDQTDLVEGGPAFRSAPHFDERRHHAQTASRITFTLLAITAATVLIHFASVIAADLFERPALTGSLAEIFRVWIPLLSGFLGSALAYYFAQRGQ